MFGEIILVEVIPKFLTDFFPFKKSGGNRSQMRRQSTTEEILIARGFRRESTTEDIMRCRNFRRQSAQVKGAFLDDVTLIDIKAFIFLLHTIFFLPAGQPTFG
jgi:hypothetical protein